MLFSSLAFPGRLETEAVGASNLGVRVADGPISGRRAWWGQKVTELLALCFTQTGSLRSGWSNIIEKGEILFWKCFYK